MSKMVDLSPRKIERKEKAPSDHDVASEEEPTNFAPMFDLMMGLEGHKFDLPKEAKMLDLLKNHAFIDDFNSQESMSQDEAAGERKDSADQIKVDNPQIEKLIRGEKIKNDYVRSLTKNRDKLTAFELEIHENLIEHCQKENEEII